MTKKWSSTASLDGHTKRSASKAERREAENEVQEFLRVCDEYGLDPIGDFERARREADKLKQN